MELLIFFSAEFAKPDIVTHHDYLLTATLADIILYEYGVDGIIYPSVRADYHTQNVALKPESLDKIDLDKVWMYELFINDENVLIDNVAYAVDLGDNKNKFNWIPLDRTSDEDIYSVIGR